MNHRNSNSESTNQENSGLYVSESLIHEKINQKNRMNSRNSNSESTSHENFGLYVSESLIHEKINQKKQDESQEF